MPGSSPSTPGADSRRGSDSAGNSDNRSRRQSGEGDQTASSDSDGVDADGKNSDDISFEEPEETASAEGGEQQSDGSSGDFSVEAAANDQVLQEAFEVFGAQGKSQPGQQDAGDGEGPGGPQAGGGNSGTAGTAGGGGTTADRIGELNAELDSALGTFDGVILAERDAVKTGDDARADGGAGTDGDELEDEGGDFGGGFAIPAAPPSSGSGSGSGSGQVATAGSENSSGSGTQPARAGDNRKGDYQHASTDSAVPADIPDGSDDDVVARQIREAAQRETDPELREKLWDEYRKYKKGK